MTEIDAIKLATLHLDGEAHEWWYHGLVTLGHNTVTSYSDFTQRFMERFDKKELEIHFKDCSAQADRQCGDIHIRILESCSYGI